MIIPYKAIRKTLANSTRTQRCWDLAQTISQEHIEIIVDSVRAAPVKQNYAYFHLHVVTNRSRVEQLYSHTQGFGFPDSSEPTGLRLEHNSQVMANCVLVFEPYDTGENLNRNLERAQGKLDSLRHDQMTAISMAAAYANYTSHLVGLRTGFCECFYPEGVKHTLDLEHNPTLMLGIGYPDRAKHRCKHHVDNTITYPSHPKEPVPVTRHT